MTEGSRRQYTAEFKREAVALVTEQRYKIAEAARSLGIRPNLLGRWRQEYLSDTEHAFPGTGHQNEADELTRLREENRRLKMEREILKKAAAFFAKESG